MGSIFGVDGDRYCRYMFESADLGDLIIDPWQMWQRVSENTVACKFCRLYADSGYIQHECGWWEPTGIIDGLLCFCFCHDDLGYVLNDGDMCLFCRSKRRNRLDILPAFWSKPLLSANALQIFIGGSEPDFWIRFNAYRDDSLILSDLDTGPLHPSQVLSIQSFSKFIRVCKAFKAKAQVYRRTILGQSMTMQSKRHFRRCSQSLWFLVDDKTLDMIMHLKMLRLQAISPT